MGQEQGAVSTSVGVQGEASGSRGAGGASSPEQLRDEIEQTRQDLGDTVAALADKTDVKTRAKERVADVKHAAAEKREHVMGRARRSSPESASTAATQVKDKARQNPLPATALVAFAAGFIAGRMSGR